ncbi:unnamed protein product, partial [marine sediment metagenome]
INNQELIVHRETERSWCYIDDAIEVMNLIVDRKQKESYEVFNIGREDPLATELLAEKIIKICNSSSETREIEVEPTIIPVKRACFKKAKVLLGWEAKTPIEQGLNELFKWMKK